MSELSKQIYLSKLILQSEISAFPKLFSSHRPLPGNIVIFKKEKKKEHVGSPTITLNP